MSENVGQRRLNFLWNISMLCITIIFNQKKKNENDDNIKYRNIPEKSQSSLSDICRHGDVYLRISICFMCCDCSSYWKPFRLFRVVLFSESPSFQWKRQIEDISFSGNRSFMQETFLLVKTVPQWKSFRLFEVFPFSGS